MKAEVGRMARGLEAATQVPRHLLPLRMAVLCARSGAVGARRRGGRGQVPPGKTPGGGPEQWDGRPPQGRAARCSPNRCAAVPARF